MLAAAPTSRRQARRHQPAPLLRAGAAHEGGHRRGQDRPAGARRLHHVQLARPDAITAPTPGAAAGTPRAAASWSTSRRTSSTCCSGSWATSRRGQRLLGQPQPPGHRGRRHGRGDRSASTAAASAPSSPACRRSPASTPRSTSTARTARRSASRPTAARRSSRACRRSPSRRSTTLDHPRRGAAARRIPGRGPRTLSASRRHDALPRLQIQDFLPRDPRRPPAAGDRRGRPACVEMFTAIYRSNQERRSIALPLTEAPKPSG